MLDEVSRMKSRYAQTIEDGKRIQAFTSLPEWQWYVERVIKPTIAEYTERMIRGDLKTSKDDWIIRGMIQGLRLVIDTPEQFKEAAEESRKKAKALQESLDDEL